MIFEESGTRARSLVEAEEVMARLAREICCPNRLEDDARLMVVIIVCGRAVVFVPVGYVRRCYLVDSCWSMVDTAVCMVAMHKVGEKGI